MVGASHLHIYKTHTLALIAWPKECVCMCVFNMRATTKKAATTINKFAYISIFFL